MSAPYSLFTFVNGFDGLPLMPTTKNRTVVSGKESLAHNSLMVDENLSQCREGSSGTLHRALLLKTLCLSQLPTGSDAAEARSSAGS